MFHGLCFWCYVHLCGFASGTGDDGESPSRKSSQSDGEFHAWLVHPEHVFEANLIQLRVRLFPNTNEFPGMKKADVNRFDDTVVQATIALEDISVPLWNTQIANRPQSHIQREKARGRAAVEWTRRAILNASGLLVVNPRYAKDNRQVHCRLVLLDESGDRVDLGTLLLKNGVCVPEGFGLGSADTLKVFSTGATHPFSNQSRGSRENGVPDFFFDVVPKKAYN